MNQVVYRIAATAFVVGLTTVGCTQSIQTAGRPAATGSQRTERDALKLHDQAYALAGKRDFAGAVPIAEQAVELAPRDVAYRMLLADLYLKSGRFQSAETAFADVLSLNPGNDRAALSLALVQVALGKPGEAAGRIDSIAGTAAPGDVGLAYALAGRVDQAIALLEPAARADGADARTRQNLALAYAFAGDWKKARNTAAQDIAPIELQRRMEQWAAMAKPAEAHVQVASLLGVQPVADPGQPVRLALAPAVPDQAYAAAEPVAAPTPEPTPEVEVAAAAVEAPPVFAPVEAPVAQPAIVETVEAAPVIEAPVFTASLPASAPPSIATVFEKAPRVAGADAKPKPRKLDVALRAAKADGAFVVQIGAYSSPGSVERAWSNAEKRYGLSDATPLSTTVTIPGKGRFHRLALSGFGSRGDAANACAAIKSKGGSCFVRANAGDAPIQWASRKAPKRA